MNGNGLSCDMMARFGLEEFLISRVLPTYAIGGLQGTIGQKLEVVGKEEE